MASTALNTVPEEEEEDHPTLASSLGDSVFKILS